MILYFLIYGFIIFLYILISIKSNKLFQINLLSFFILSHILLFLITPILFQQHYILEDHIFQNISYISLISILTAFSFKISFLNNIYLEPKINIIRWIFYIMVVVSIYSIFINITNINIDRTMTALKGEYQGRGIFSILKTLYTILGMIYLGYLYNTNKKKFILFYFILFFSLILSSAHRTPVAILFISPILLYFIYNKNATFKLVHLIVTGILIANLMFFMNFYRQGIINQISLNNNSIISTSFLNSLSGMNTTKNLYMLIETNYPIQYFEKIYYLFIGFIPRKLYPEKPVVSFNVRTTEDVFGYKIGAFKGADVITYTVPGEGYIQFSYLGVFLMTFLSAILSRILIVLYLKIKYIDFILISFLFSIFINFRSAFDSFYYTVIYNLAYLIILLPFFRIKKGQINTKLSVINRSIHIKWK